MFAIKFVEAVDGNYQDIEYYVQMTLTLSL